jgi:hypothetical protein
MVEELLFSIILSKNENGYHAYMFSPKKSILIKGKSLSEFIGKLEEKLR